jgi:DNA-binding transcriptional ArsR family regulator
MGLWAKSLLIFNSIRENGKQSIRKLARHTGLSKSSVHRHLQAIDRRDRYPESGLWETPEGRNWLIRLVVATLFIFGLKRGVGAETISEFFGRLHLEAHVGCSPSALRSLLQMLERTIVETAAAWEQEGIDHGEIRPIIGAVDETFLQRMMLVFMDLASGYLLLEEGAVDRTYDTWSGLVKARLKTLGVEVSYLVSDRAKALIKLAETGLDCLSIPDVFHLSHDLTKSYSLAIFSRLRQAQQALTQARECLVTVQASHTDRAQVQSAQVLVAASEAEVKRWQDVRSAYRNHLTNLSLILHPWCLLDSTRQTSNEVERRLQDESERLESLIERYRLPAKKNTLAKVRKQLAGISALVDFWWQTVERDLEHMALPPRWKHWVDELLLPLMYWQHHVSHTRCPGQKAQIARALKAIQEAFERHPCTQRLGPEVLAGWKAWAAEHAKAFQRASSAVEGRNGYLSQMQHNHRGLPPRRYPVWTVLHNFDCRASDRTTPASRFFRREFPDLFESVLSQIDDLPLPRQRHQALAVSD